MVAAAKRALADTRCWSGAGGRLAVTPPPPAGSWVLEPSFPPGGGRGWRPGGVFHETGLGRHLAKSRVTPAQQGQAAVTWEEGTQS